MSKAYMYIQTVDNGVRGMDGGGRRHARHVESPKGEMEFVSGSVGGQVGTPFSVAPISTRGRTFIHMRHTLATSVVVHVPSCVVVQDEGLKALRTRREVWHTAVHRQGDCRPIKSCQGRPHEGPIRGTHRHPAAP